MGIVTFQHVDVNIHCKKGRHAVKCVFPLELYRVQDDIFMIDG